ncbi:MAG: hypothetical protein COW32_07510, partial [Candidatus Aquicultor secundus]
MIKKVIVGLMAVAMLFAMTGLAFAVQDNTNGTGPYTTSGYIAGQKGNITPDMYNLDSGGWNDGNGNSFTFNKPKNWTQTVQSVAIKDGFG